jgi:uncharacterized protein GlcG (DUF336 family)
MKFTFALFALAFPVLAQGNGNCAGLPTDSQLRALLRDAPGSGGDAGGLFHGERMWGAIVNKDGELCAVAASTADPRGVWPGSQAIAKAKAYTANAFSLDDFALSTARLYTFTQPGRSLWSLGQSNLFDTQFLLTPNQTGGKKGGIAGGLIFFGGGVPLYRNGKIAGGLGISGDTSCADHEIAKRVRNLANLNPTGGPSADDIRYSSVDGADAFSHPTCINTWRNGIDLNKGEQPASGY